ncbi:hypothetical protein ACLB2K_029283 [Fragaria x ananassa]
MVVGEASYGDTSSAIEKCHSLPESSGTNNKKRMIDGPPEAYTVELEAELNQLQEENIKLKQCLAEIEQRQKQEVRCSLLYYSLASIEADHPQCSRG